MNSKPKISVLMITYNHASYIRQALDSVFSQETDFSYEVVIGDDASTDGTGAILAEYAKRHPDRIRLLQRAKNLGMNANFAATLDACQGEYVALLEGDDYWIGSRKLARQAAFLDSHPDCVSCFHNVIIFSDDPRVAVQGYYAQTDGRQLMCAPDLATRFSQKDFLKQNVMPTCSVMFRRSSAGSLPPWFEKLSLGDHPLHILCTEHGLAAYLPEVMGAYRLHGSGVWSGNSSLHRIARTLEMYEALGRHFQGRPQGAIVQNERLQVMQAYARLLKKNGRLPEAAAMAGAYLKLAVRNPWFCISNLSRLTRMILLFWGQKFTPPARP